MTPARCSADKRSTFANKASVEDGVGDGGDDATAEDPAKAVEAP